MNDSKVGPADLVSVVGEQAERGQIGTASTIYEEAECGTREEGELRRTVGAYLCVIGAMRPAQRMESKTGY
jgi:hypothetical protein